MLLFFRTHTLTYKVRDLDFQVWIIFFIEVIFFLKLDSVLFWKSVPLLIIPNASKVSVHSSLNCPSQVKRLVPHTPILTNLVIH